MVELDKQHPKLEVKIQRDVSERVLSRDLMVAYTCSKAPESVNAIPLMDIDLAVALPRAEGVDAAYV